MIVGGLVGRGVAALLGGSVRHGVVERDDELDAREEAVICCQPPGAGWAPGG